MAKAQRVRLHNICLFLDHKACCLLQLAFNIECMFKLRLLGKVKAHLPLN